MVLISSHPEPIYDLVTCQNVRLLCIPIEFGHPVRAGNPWTFGSAVSKVSSNPWLNVLPVGSERCRSWVLGQFLPIVMFHDDRTKLVSKVLFQDFVRSTDEQTKNERGGYRTATARKADGGGCGGHLSQLHYARTKPLSGKCTLGCFTKWRRITLEPPKLDRLMNYALMLRSCLLETTGKTVEIYFRTKQTPRGHTKQETKIAWKTHQNSNCKLRPSHAGH